MPSVRTCPRCRRPLPGDTLRGLCPICLLQGALDDEPESLGGSDSEEAPETDPGRRSRTAHPKGQIADLERSLRDGLLQSRDDRSSAPGNRAAGDPLVPGRRSRALHPGPLRRQVDGTGRGRVLSGAVPDRDTTARGRDPGAGTGPGPAADGVPGRHLLPGKSRGLAMGNYLILDKIGKGGMGMVFKAQHRRMKRVVALKVLPPSYARDDSAVLRFQREVQAVARLGHPNIVAALDADVFNGLHFFAMEYVEGSDLAPGQGEGDVAGRPGDRVPHASGPRAQGCP